LNHAGESLFREFPRIRRVEKGEIEGRKRAGRTELGRVAPPDLGGACQPQRLDVPADGSTRFRAVLDEERETCTAGDRLEAERAGACEQIEHARTVEIDRSGAVFEDVEKRLSDAVGGGPRGEPLWRLNVCAPEPPRYNAHAPSLGKTSLSFMLRATIAAVAAAARGPAAPAL
jgi:hypothetical protein